MLKNGIVMLFLGICAITSLEAKTPTPNEEQNPRADFTYTQDAAAMKWTSPGRTVS
jgi:hypothetical protein